MKAKKLLPKEIMDQMLSQESIDLDGVCIIEESKKIKSTKQNFKKKVYKNFLILQENNDFIKDVIFLRKKWRIPVEIPEERFSDFEKDVKKMRKKFKLSEPYHLLLLYYIQNKEIAEDILDILIDFDDFIITPESCDEQYILLKIYPDMTIEDVRELWSNLPHVKRKYLGVQTKRNNNRPNLKRDKYMLDLKKKGYRLKEIKDLTNKKFGCLLGYEDISKILQRLQNVASKKS